jgi:hypothetical protein
VAMTPEVRKGIEELLAGGYTGNPATIAWLHKQLAHDDWDNQIERMGGGPTARNARMQPIFDELSATTLFDLHAQIMTDGRERGLWVWLYDESKARAETYEKWAENALDTFCELAKIPRESMKRFSAAMAMDQFKNVSNSKVDEAALLEWPEVKKLYDAIGKELEKRCPPKKTKSRTKKSTSAKRARGGSTATR